MKFQTDSDYLGYLRLIYELLLVTDKCHMFSPKLLMPDLLLMHLFYLWSTYEYHVRLYYLYSTYD